jgi:hypothetical protein
MPNRTNRPLLGYVFAALALIVAGISLGQVPGQFPGQGPGPAPTPSGPPIHIPHIGHSQQERPEFETSTEGPVYVLLWFDMDDYIQPQSDEMAKRLAIYLTQEGVPATVKIDGEEARQLKLRGRQDVITAIAQHDIGYLSNTYSQHPTIAEYEANMDWESGAAEFARRERTGYDDVAHTFRKAPQCYGQPGTAWAPQAFAALEKWGVHVYLGEGRQVGLRGKPFWYGGLLNLFNLRAGDFLRPDETWSNLDSAKMQFQDRYVAMTARKTGGVISLHFRPSEFVNKDAWDEINFKGGANPPPAAWKVPAMKSPDETEKEFQYFTSLIEFLKSFPRVQFLTASAAAQIFRDRARMHVFTPQEIGTIAGQVDSNVTFQAEDGYFLSASELFLILNDYLAATIQRQSVDSIILESTPDGPDSAPEPMHSQITIPWVDFAKAVLDVQDSLTKTGRIPSAIRFGNQQIAPESYLGGIAQAILILQQNAEPPREVVLSPFRLASAQFVADDSPELWDWAILPQGFHAPKMMSLAKLQAWTLKPAFK